jgi:hypothetical protein
VSEEPRLRASGGSERFLKERLEIVEEEPIELFINISSILVSG